MIDKVVGEGRIITLTTNTDAGISFTGGTGNDVYTTVLQAAGATGTTIQPGDNLNGGAGIDTLSISVAGSLTANTPYTLAAVSTTGIEQVLVSNFDTTTGGGTSEETNTIDTSLMAGLTTVVLSASAATGDTLFTKMQNFVSAEMKNGSADLTLTYDGAQVITGTTDVQNLAISNLTGGTFTANGMETVNVSSTTVKSTLTAIVGDALATITITGDQNLIVSNAVIFAATGNAAAVDGTINASAFTGALNIDASGSTSTVSVVGGSGNDTITMGTTLTTNDVINGGTGTDVLAIADSLSSTMSNVTGIEVLRVSGSSKTYDSTKIAGLTTIQVNGGTSLSVTALANNANISVIADTTSATTYAATAADGTLNLTIDNSIAKDTTGVDAAPTTLTNIKTLNVASTGGNLSSTVSAVNSNSLDLGTTSALTKIVVTGDTNLSLDNDGTIDTTIGAIHSTVTTVDANAFTGALYVTATSVASTITGGSGSDSITGGSANDVLTAAAGNDTIASGGGDDNISAGAGNDGISLGAASGATKVVTVTGGEGNDTITMTSATGVFNLAGDAGDDSFVVAGTTSIYFDGSDSLVAGDGTDSLTFAGTHGAAYDLATNSGYLANVSGFESVKLNVSGLTTNNHTLSFTFNDVLASSIGAGTLALSVVDAATPAANAGADVTIDASGVLLSSTRVNLTASAAVQYVYSVGGATENVVLGAQVDTVKVSNVVYLGATDTVTGGDGSDTLALNYGTTSSTAVTFNTTNMTGVTGFETVNLDGGTGTGTGAITATITEAFATANKDISSNTFTMGRSQLGTATIDDTGTTSITASAVTATKLVLSGADGADTLIGGAMDDIITGNGGNDSLTGGTGNDSFVATASMGSDTISDFGFGTSSTTVDKLDFSAITTITSLTLTDGAIFRAATDTITSGDNILILSATTYATTAAVETAVDTIVASTATGGAIILWQDTLGNVHVSTDTAIETDSSGFVDHFVLQGVTITGISSLVNATDFAV